MIQPLWKTNWQFKKLNIHFLYDSAIVCLAMYPREMKTYFSTRNYAWLFIVTLFGIAKNLKKTPKCLMVGEQLKTRTFIPWNSTQPIAKENLLIHNMDKFQGHYVEWKQSISSHIWFHLYNILDRITEIVIKLMVGKIEGCWR